MTVMSVRFSDGGVHQRLKRAAESDDVGLSKLAERLIDEGLRQRSHPRVQFRDGPAGRRPGLVSGPDVAEVIPMIVGSDVAPSKRVARAADLLSLPVSDVEACLSYYADFQVEVDRDIARRIAAADEAEQRWRRSRELVER
jgi:hypothetical protein